MAEFSDLLGKTIEKIGFEKDDDGNITVIKFFCDEDDSYCLMHIQDCCEDVHVQDICGDLNDLIGSPLTLAEEVESGDCEGPKPNAESESWMWTFYKLATTKGYVTIRWLGESNGYYSESVDFVKA